MAENLHSNSQIPSDIPSFISRKVKPSSEFYSIFSETEVLGIIHALEFTREIPLKYSYKDRGAKIWNDFYLKYIIPTWYRQSNVEIDLLNTNFEYLIGQHQGVEKFNVIDVGAGNSYPVKKFIGRLNKLGKINKYIALDISDELLNLSRNNFTKWFPFIDFSSQTIDIETSCIPKSLYQNLPSDAIDDTANIILHLGVTMGNHQNRISVLKNFRESMVKHDYLVFTSEIGSNSQWDGRARGGCDYHAEQVYQWIKSKWEISAEDCELIRKYDDSKDSIVANIKFRQNYTINFNLKEIDKNIEIAAGEEITIWRHHKYEMPELMQELAEAGLKMVRYSTNKYLSHIMVICEVVSN